MLRLILLLLALTAVVAAVATWSAGGGEPPPPREPPVPGAAALPDAAGPLASAPPPAAELAATVAPERRAAEVPAAPREAPRPASELVVRALDEGGAPLAGVTVSPRLPRWDDGRRDALARRRSGDDGRARWPLAPGLLEEGDSLSLFLHGAEGRPPVSWTGEWSGAPLDVRLARGAVLSGRATFAETGGPVAEGRISVHWSVSDAVSGSTTAPVARDGSYRAEDVAGRVDSVGLIRAGHRYVSVEPAGLELAPGGTAHYDVAFSEGPRLALRAVDAASGEPVAGARVRARAGPRCTTAADGRGELRGAFAGGEDGARLHVELEEFEPRDVVVDRAQALAGEVAIELARGSVVAGVVVDVAGVPLPGVAVLARRTQLYGIGGSRRNLLERRAETDAEGRFRLAGLPACRDLDLVVLEGSRPLAYERLRLPEGAGERVVALAPTASLSGVVVDASGAPAADHHVVAFHAFSGASADARTDAEGRFELSDLHPGEWIVAARWGAPLTWGGSYTYRRRVARAARVGAGREWLRLELPGEPPPSAERLELRVAVTDAATGAPLERVDWFQVVGVDSTLGLGLTGAPLEEGELRYELPPGVHTISVHVEGRALFQQNVELRAGEDPPVLQARMRRDG